jgi:hypothetical protein
MTPCVVSFNLEYLYVVVRFQRQRLQLQLYKKKKKGLAIKIRQELESNEDRRVIYCVERPRILDADAHHVLPCLYNRSWSTH